MTQRAEITKLLFGHHPNAKGFYLTADNQAFSEKTDADNHAKSLTEKEVDWVENPCLGKNVNADDQAEREALIERHQELFGTPAAKNIKTETLKAKIAEKEAELAAAGGEGDDKGE